MTVTEPAAAELPLDPSPTQTWNAPVHPLDSRPVADLDDRQLAEMTARNVVAIAHSAATTTKLVGWMLAIQVLAVVFGLVVLLNAD